MQQTAKQNENIKRSAKTHKIFQKIAFQRRKNLFKFIIYYCNCLSISYFKFFLLLIYYIYINTMGYMQVASQIKSFINKEVQLILKLIIVLSLIYLVLVNVSLLTLFIFAVILLSLAVFLKLKFKQLKQEGLLNKVSPKMRQVLMQKSIFDIYSDALYFPVITRIIGAFLRPIISKPHPQDLKKSFQNIPQKARQIISTKGLIHLFPKSIQQLAYKQGQIMEPPKKNEWKWNNAEIYKMHQQVHQQTVSKQLMEKIDKKASWSSLLFMALIVGYGIKSMNPSRAKKMFIQNGCFVGIILIIMIAIVKLKKRKSQNQKRYPLFEIQDRPVQIQ